MQVNNMNPSSQPQEHPEFKWSPFKSLLRREIKRFLKVFGQTVATPLINTSLYLLIFGVSLGKSIDMGSGVSYLSFLIPGLITMTVLNNAFQNSSSSILSSKFHGDIHDLKVVPLTTHQIIWAFSVASLIRGAFVGGMTFVVSEAFFFITEQSILSVQHPFLLLLFLIAGGLSFGFIGISVGFWARSFDQLSAIGGFVLLPLIYLGGVFYSISGLHPFWQMISKMNPLLYFVNGVRFSVLGHADISFTKSLIISIFGTLILYFFAFRSIQKGSFQKW